MTDLLRMRRQVCASAPCLARHSDGRRLPGAAAARARTVTAMDAIAIVLVGAVAQNTNPGSVWPSRGLVGRSGYGVGTRRRKPTTPPHGGEENSHPAGEMGEGKTAGVRGRRCGRTGDVR